MPRGQAGTGRGKPAVQGFSNRPEAVRHRQVHRNPDGSVEDDFNREEDDIRRQPRTRGGNWHGNEVEEAEELSTPVCLNLSPEEAYHLATVIKNAVDDGDDTLEPILNTLGTEIMSHFQGHFGEDISQFIQGPPRNAVTRGGGPRNRGGRGR